MPDTTEPLPLDHCWAWESCPAREDVSPIIDFVAEAMAAWGYSDNDLFDVQVGLAEALHNAIRHGHRGDLTRPVRVRHHVNERRVLVEVEDQGEGFDPDSVPDPRAPENLERPGGRGLLLMRHSLSWVRHNARGNCVTLCKYRSPE